MPLMCSLAHRTALPTTSALRDKKSARQIPRRREGWEGHIKVIQTGGVGACGPQEMCFRGGLGLLHLPALTWPGGEGGDLDTPITFGILVLSLNQSNSAHIG